MALIAVAGARTLNGQMAEQQVTGLVRSIVKERTLAVGCAIGADCLALEAALALGGKPEVFAAFGPDGTGAWKGSAIPTVQKAVNCGAIVHWWAGGKYDVPLTSRLKNRTLAMVRTVASSGPGNGVVAFIRPDSRGTLLTIRESVRLGIPVVVFLAGGAQLPDLEGKWHPAGKGIWSAGFRFVPQ